MTLIEIAQQIEALESAVDVPWSVSRSGIKPSFFGSNIALTSSDDADWLSTKEAKQVVEWLVEQLGGKVKWPK